MAVKQFLSTSVKWWPQPSYSVTVTDNGGAEATQDVLLRKSDLDTSVAASFARNTRWEDIFPEVPQAYRNLKLKTAEPTDRGDGMTILRCNFSGYTLAAPGSSGDEAAQFTTSLNGQLTSEPLSTHPKWTALFIDVRQALGLLLSGEYIWEDNKVRYKEDDGSLKTWQTKTDLITANDDAVFFANMIAEGDTTWDRGGWTYSYHTESETGFTSAQLNSLGKIVANPFGSPKDPGAGWTWQLASPNQSQSGDNRFIKSLDYRLIQDNAKNQFLYGA